MALPGTSHATALEAVLDANLGNRRFEPIESLPVACMVLDACACGPAPYFSMRQTPSRKTSRFGRLGPARA
jgi:hypothetical protein